MAVLRNPLRGLPFSEQRRIAKLARSRRVLSTSRDAKLAEGYARHHMAMARLFRWLGVVTVVASVVRGAVAIVQREWGGLVRPGIGLALVAAAELVAHHMRVQILRTARLNGWDLRPAG